LNDPACEEKFDRNPLTDSFLDQDYGDLLKVGGTRKLLDLDEPKGNRSLDGNDRSLDDINMTLDDVTE